MKSINTQRIFHYLHFIFLPLILALLFAIQNQVFNNQLSLFASQYSNRLLVVSFALGLILYSPSLFFHKRGRYIYLFLISCFISLIFLVQFISFEYGQSFFQVSALEYIGQIFAVTGTAKTFFSFKLLIFVSNIFLVGVAFIFSFKNYISFNILRNKTWEADDILFLKKEKIMLFLLLLVIAFTGYNFLIKEEKKDWGNTSRLYKDVYDLNTLVEKIGIINFTFEDAVKYILRTNLVTTADKNFLVSWAKKQASLQNTLKISATGKIPPEKNPNYFGIAKGKNVIFIQVESLENCVIGQSVNGQEITPNLNQLAKQGLYFSNYYTQVGPGNTADAEFSTLNSLYPLSDDVVFVDYSQNQYNALPKLLDKNGYHAYALHGDVPTFWNRSNIYPNLGYQQQISEGDYIMSRPIGKGPSPLGDEDFLNQSLPKMEHFKQPFFSTLITESSHTPFELPEDLQTLEIPKDTNLNYVQQQYLESIHYMDGALGEFMKQLKQETFYNNSVIFIYGDHGSYTNICDPLQVGDQTFPGLVHSQVPLLVLNSGINNEEINTPSSHLDLFPTVSNLVGIKAPQDILGQDIFNSKTPVVTRRNLFSGTINTILTKTLAFKANANGVFKDGTCLKIPEETSLPVTDCQTIYNQQADTIKSSDIIVRGNLLNLFLTSLKH